MLVFTVPDMPSDAAVARAERRRVEARDELARAAFEVFDQRGYHATRINDITSYLGVGQGTFYRHFAGKRDVIDYVLDQRLAAMLDAVSAENAATAADTLDDYIAQVRRISEVLVRAAAENPQVLRLMLFEATSIDADLTARLSGVLDVATTVVKGYYRNGIDKGYLRADLDVEANTQAVGGLLLGGLLGVLRSPTDDDAQIRYAAVAIEMVVCSAAREPRGQGRGRTE